MKFRWFAALLLAGLMAGCAGGGNQPAATPTEPNPRMDEAQVVLQEYFNLLNSGQYAQAAEMYGGGYEELVERNPDVSADQPAVLFERACTQNGYRCLPIKSVLYAQEMMEGVYAVSVQLENPDGSIFSIPACCGEEVTENPPQNTFTYRVEDTGSSFRILDLPPYWP